MSERYEIMLPVGVTDSEPDWDMVASFDNLITAIDAAKMVTVYDRQEKKVVYPPEE